MTQDQFARDLMELEVIRFGEFTLKSGLSSPFYLDLRQLLKDPQRLDQAAELLAEKARGLEFDVIAGIPYTAVPLAALAAVKLGKPLVIPRKEEKLYGTGGTVMGAWKKGEICLVIDDLITTGSSKLETAAQLEKEGLIVRDFLVIIDRRGNRKDELEEKGYRLSSILSLPDLLARLEKQNLIPKEKAGEIRRWLEAGETREKSSELPPGQRTVKEVPANPLTQKILDLMEEKQSNLVLSLDVTSRKEFFRILNLAGDKIVLLKTHVDILEDFDSSFVEELKAVAAEKRFLLFEDRKFADIGNTVRHQYREGIYRIRDWADFVTAHLIAGEGTLQALFQGTENRGGFLLARMSSKGNLITREYTEKVLETGIRCSQWVCGYIGHGTDARDIRALRDGIPREQLLLVPGVQLSAGGDSLGQQYLSVEEAVKGGADLLIAGRGIFHSEDPEKTAELYRARGWQARTEQKQKEDK